jgi:hypothetical protein
MRPYIAVCAVAAAAVLAACSKPAPEPPPAPAPTVFDPLTSDLDKARQVQGVVDQQAEKSRQAVAAQEQGDVH